MPTLVQLSEALVLNLDTVTVLRLEDVQWDVWCGTPGPISLTGDEKAVLALYLRNHTERATYHAWQRGTQS